MDFPTLQKRIASLAQELKDEILFWLIKVSLQPGKIFLDGRGTPYTEDPSQRASDKEASRLNISILRLSKKMLPSSAKLLYEGNVWVMPSGALQRDFFHHWNRHDLRLLPAVEMQPQRSEIGVWHSPEPRLSAPFNAALRFEGFYLDNDSLGSINEMQAKANWRLYLSDVWCRKVFPRESLLPGDSGCIYEDQDDRRGQKSVPESLVYGFQARRKTVLGVPWLEGRRGGAGQVVAFGERSRKEILAEIERSVGFGLRDRYVGFS